MANNVARRGLTAADETAIENLLAATGSNNRNDGHAARPLIAIALGCRWCDHGGHKQR
jgi:hypothetical protein